MKLQGKAIDGFLKRPDPKIRVVLLYGPDSGLVRDRAERVGRSVIDDFSDPFRVADLTSKTISDDPARLSDEAAALSLTGGRRLVRIRDAEDTAAAAFAAFFKAPPPGDSLIVIEAGDLNARSKLRALFEAADTGVAIPCYVEDESAMGAVISGLLREHGLSANPDTLSYLSGRLVGDRKIALGEIEKLALYSLGKDRVGLEDAEACVGDNSTPETDEPILAAADGDFAGLDRALGRLFGEGAAAVAILRSGQRHFQRLQIVAAAVGQGKSPDAAVDQLKPPVFFKMRSRIVNQARRWTASMVRQALDRLIDAEADVKRTGFPDQTICARVLFQIASMGRR